MNQHKVNGIGRRVVLGGFAGLCMMLTSFAASAKFNLVPTLNFLRDANMLASASRQLARASYYEIGNHHPITQAALSYRNVVRAFVKKANRYHLFKKDPITDQIKIDFEPVRVEFAKLRQAIKTYYQEEGMYRVRRKYDKVIYRYHRLRHSIDVHIAQAKKP